MSTTDTQPAAVLSGVVKHFPQTRGFRDLLRLRPRESVQVLKGVDLSLQSGRITGLLGVNGSGKTTLLRLLSGLLVADGGELSVLGRDPAEEASRLKGEVGVVLPNERGFFWRLSVRRNLEFFGVLHDLEPDVIRERVEALAEKLGLSERLDRPFRDLSDGMKQRVAVARGLLAPSRLLLVDEATRSLDPAGAERVRGIIKDAARDGAAVLMVSHNLDEVAAVCDELMLLEDGRIELQGPADEMHERIKARLFEREGLAT